MFKFLKKKDVSFTDQLMKLAELGITLNPGIDPTLFLAECSAQAYQKDPFQLLLISMGGEIYKDGQFHIASNHIWHLDTECIEDHGDYVTIVERLKNLMNIEIQNIQDFVDIENEEAWVSFEYEDKHVKWDLNVDNDWIDSEIFDKFIQLFGTKANRKLVIASLGQDCLVAYLNEEQLKEINKLMKHKFM
jgi:hypothetical protein